MDAPLSTLLTLLASSDLNEERDLALKIKKELDTTIKSFVRRSNDKYGKAFQNYLKQVKKTSQSIVAKEIKPIKVSGAMTKLVDWESEKKSIDKIVTSIMYEQSPSTSYQNIFQQVKKISKEKKIKIIRSL